MIKKPHAGIGVIAGLYFLLGLGCAVGAQPPAPTPVAGPKEAVVAHARGTFDVKLNPHAADDGADPTVARMSIDKQFHGDLEATSKGQMLAVRTDIEGSAGYVAMERVSGMLNGRSGTFVLQHTGTMTRGAPQLSITVVPDSGTGQLVGLAGKMGIEIADGKHSYEFEYTLTEAR